MKPKTKTLLAVGLGVVAVGGVIYAVTRDGGKKKSNGGGLTVGPGKLPVPPQPKPARAGIWVDTYRPKIEALAAQAFTDMGAPAQFSWQLVVEVANAAASEMWPSMQWPTTVTESDKMLLQREYGSSIWLQVFQIAQKTVGYIPEVGP